MKKIKEKIKIVGWAILITGLLTGAVYAQDPSEGLVPAVRVLYPNLGNQSVKIVPPNISVGILGTDAPRRSASASSAGLSFRGTPPT